MSKRRWVFVFVVLLTVSLACATFGNLGRNSTDSENLVEPSAQSNVVQKDAGVVEERESNPLNVTPTLEEGNTVRAFVFPDEETNMTVTASDGTVFTLTFPKNAVLSPVEVSMTPIASLEGFPEEAGETHAVHLEPEGLTLMEPAMLSIQPGSDAGEFTAFTTYSGGKDLHFSPSKTENSAVNIPLMHFSDPGASIVGENVLQDIQESYPPASYTAYWKQAITDYLVRVKDKDRRNDLIEKGFEAWEAEMKDKTLIPAQTNENLIDKAISDYLAWQNWYSFISSFDESTGDILVLLNDENLEARELLATGLWNALDKTNQKCEAEKDPDEAVRMLRYYAVTEKLNLWKEDRSEYLDKVTAQLMIEDCVEFHLDLDSTLVMMGESVFTHKMTSKVPIVSDFKSVPESFSSQVYEVGYEAYPMDYQEFTVTGLPSSCNLDKGGGTETVKVYLGLNYYEDPPRFDENVTVLMHFPEESWEVIDCTGGTSPLRFSFWVDMFRVLHRVEAAGGGGKLLFQLKKVKTQDYYANYSSDLDIGDLTAWIENSQNDPAQTPGDLEKLDEYGDAIKEHSTLKLIYLK